MTNNTTPTKASFLARSRKAIAGGITGAVSAGGAALATAAADGAIDAADGWVVAGAIVGGFLVGAVGVWSAPANAA